MPFLKKKKFFELILKMKLMIIKFLFLVSLVLFCIIISLILNQWKYLITLESINSLFAQFEKKFVIVQNEIQVLIKSCLKKNLYNCNSQLTKILILILNKSKIIKK